MLLSESVHIPILKDQILKDLLPPFLKASTPAYMIDCTLGGGGHLSVFLERFAAEDKLKSHRFIAFDRDKEAIDRARKRFQQEISQGRLELIHRSYGAINEELEQRIPNGKVLGILADLGISSDQLATSERGFSFQANDESALLDMRMDQRSGETASDLLLNEDVQEIEAALVKWGEERYARSIARAIVAHRSTRLNLSNPWTVQELTAVILKAVPPAARHGRIHAATRTFQALRIWVNDELTELDRLLNHGIFTLSVGGRAALMSFHSLEDRMVKQAFKKYSEQFQSLTKKPMTPDENEIKRNPRSRSAKLRVVERIV